MPGTNDSTTKAAGKPLKVTLAGATGWAGSALARGIGRAADLTMVSCMSRTHAGASLKTVLDDDRIDAPIFANADEALARGPDVFVEFTKPDVARQHVMDALRAGAHVVIGTSGLTAGDLAAIDRVARMQGLGVLACGNFALTAVLMQKFSELASRWIRHWEIIDYAHAGKVDAPSGTARELAQRLSHAGESQLDIPLNAIRGERESRGTRLDGSQVHSVRLPGYVIAIESIFGMDAQKLIIRHEAGSSAEPYVDGALLAIRRVGDLVGVHRGLDTVMED
ncbi:MAG: 4-hydroxy-tetrahydrodipicolinate reductase [Planctomycetota bacterium]|jgi:4-hydroxy-tetrahydrodipicolinate reductase